MTGIALMKEMTDRTKDYLVSFGERLSTRIFAAYLKNNGVKAKQVELLDSFKIDRERVQVSWTEI